MPRTANQKPCIALVESATRCTKPNMIAPMTTAMSTATNGSRTKFTLAKSASCDARLRTPKKAGKNNADESEEFHGAAPVGLEWLHHPATQESETAADSCNTW
jgi:hypothetical protein